MDQKELPRRTKLFLSYGHTEREIAKLIRESLMEDGFDVWIDESEIKEGDDWRARIAQGILESQGVVGCLSRYSVRDPGVCLDELSISVGYCYGNIVTLLLEPESEVKVPSSVSHIQWIDMSGWKTEMTRNEEALQPNAWFEERMQILKNVLHSGKTEEYLGEIERLRQKLIYVDVRMGKLQYLQKKPFIGREWLNRAVQDWLRCSEDRVCVVYGAPGIGKSAFMAHYMHYNPQVAGGVFCESGLGSLNDARTVVCTLAFLLACRLSNFRKLLLASFGRRNNWEVLSAEEMFQILFEECLSYSIDGGQETLLLVIDGINECGPENGSWLANTLVRYASRLPKWIRFLITSRREYYIQEPLRSCFHIDMDERIEENRKDVHSYLCKKLGDNGVTETECSDLTEKSEGVFQYAEIIADLIRNQKRTVKEMEQVPPGLDALFYVWFCSYFEQIGEYERIFPAISVILAAPAPVPEQELKRIMNWNQRELSDFKRRMGAFLVTETSIYNREMPETLDIGSSYLKAWLSDDRISGIYAADPEEGRARMAEYYLRMIRAETLSDYGLLYGTGLVCDRYPDCEKPVNSNRYLFEKIKELFRKTEKQHHYGSLRVPVFRLISAMHDSGSLERLVQADCSEEDGTMAAAAGMLYTIYGKPKIAAGYWEKVIKLWERWIRQGEELDTEDWLRYATILENMAGVCRKLYDDESAEAYYVKAIEILSRFEKTEQVNIMAELAGCCVGFAGWIQQRQNKMEEEAYCSLAKRMYRRAARIYRKLAEIQPEDYEELLASTYSDLACLLCKTNEWDSAQKNFNRALELLEQLFSNDPKRYEVKLAVLKGAIGLQQETHQDHSLALKLYQNAEALIEAHSAPLSIREQEKVAVLYHNYASALKNGNIDAKKSEELRRKSLDLQKSLTEQDFPSHSVNYLSMISSYAAETAENGNPQEAEYWLNETIRTAEAMRGINENLDFVRAAAYINAGTAYFTLGNAEKKRVCDKKALEICDRHSESIFKELADRLRDSM